MRKTVRLSESDLHRLVKESVKRAISEAQKGMPYKHFKENQYEKAAKIEWLLNDIKGKLENLKSLYNDAYPDEFDRRIQDVNCFACDALKLMDNYGFPDFNSDDYYVGESKHRVIKESDYNDYFDWASNSGASPEEIEAAGQRHDSRIPSVYEPVDTLDRRQRNFSAFQKRRDRGDVSTNQMLGLKKFNIKNDRSGGKLFTDRLNKALTPNPNR